MMTSKVTVILTSYNRTVLLAQAIESVVHQTHKNIEFFIIDDGSRAETRQIIEYYVAAHPAIKYIQTEKRDADRGRVCDYTQNINICARQSSGDYVAYLTCDDIFYDNHVDILASALDNDPDKMVVFGDQSIVSIDDNTFEISLIRHRILPPIVPIAACLVDHNMVMHRRSCFDKAGYWIEDSAVYRMGDAAFWIQLNRYWPFYRIPILTNEHRIHESSVQGL
jgi:spore maturation protein CgeD